jgi:hypothetical protein
VKTLVAVATLPEREALLPISLGSLRKQCDRLHVYLNGHAEVPACVRDLADDVVHAPENQGADVKFHWAHEHDGIYLSCDDDFTYPPDYVRRMAEAVERWEGQAFVTAHGRTYPPHPTGAGDQILGRAATLNHPVPHGRWVNHAGTGVLAWDATRIKVPLTYPVINRTDVQLSAWANARGIPIWVVHHSPNWLRPIPNRCDSVGKQSRREGHATKNALLLAHPEWKLHEIRERERTLHP